MSEQIARTILSQLGGNKFIVMTGAKNLCAHNGNFNPELPGLSFKIGFGARDGITHVRIFLRSDDTYSMEFLKIRGTNYKMISHFEMIYADQLREIFTNVTGFNVSL